MEPGGVDGDGADLRSALRRRLRWRFSFASGDPREARCLAEHPADAARVADLVVRRLRPGKRRNGHQDASFLALERSAASGCGSVASPGGLETLLRAQLRAPRVQRGVRGELAREQVLKRDFGSFRGGNGELTVDLAGSGADGGARGALQPRADVRRG